MTNTVGVQMSENPRELFFYAINIFSINEDLDFV